MSLCLARNVVPEYMLSSNEWPVIARNHLEQVSTSPEQLSSDIEAAITCIRSATWQQRYLSGFHLRMIFHAANVLNTETRFLLFLSLGSGCMLGLQATTKKIIFAKLSPTSSSISGRIQTLRFSMLKRIIFCKHLGTSSHTTAWFLLPTGGTIG